MDELIARTGKYEMRAYNKKHLIQLRVGPETRDMVDFIGVDALSDSFQARGPAFSAFFDGALFVIAGINILWPGVGEAWAMFGSGYQRHGFFIHRTTIRYINRLSDDYNLERLQAVVKQDHWAGIEWIDRLGFKYEGEMKKYFQGKTYLRYAKIFNQQASR